MPYIELRADYVTAKSTSTASPTTTIIVVVRIITLSTLTKPFSGMLNIIATPLCLPPILVSYSFLIVILPT